MQVVIDIPEEEYRKVLDGRASVSIMRNTIKNGTPLPKGHGRLIDMKKLQKFVSDYTEHDAVQLILADREDYLPTIIEADKEE